MFQKSFGWRENRECIKKCLGFFITEIWKEVKGTSVENDMIFGKNT